jgi:hypothetical protein
LKSINHGAGTHMSNTHKYALSRYMSAPRVKVNVTKLALSIHSINQYVCVSAKALSLSLSLRSRLGIGKKNGTPCDIAHKLAISSEREILFRHREECSDDEESESEKLSLR